MVEGGSGREDEDEDESSVISDEWIYKSTCPTERVEFAERKKMFFSAEV